MFKVGSETKEYIRFSIITCNVTEKSSLHTVGMISVLFCLISLYTETIAPSLVTILLLIVMACCIYGCCIWEGRADKDDFPIHNIQRVERHQSTTSANKKLSTSTSQSILYTSVLPSYSDITEQHDVYSAMEKFNYPESTAANI